MIGFQRKIKKTIFESLKAHEKAMVLQIKNALADGLKSLDIDFALVVRERLRDVINEELAYNVKPLVRKMIMDKFSIKKKK